MGRVTTDHSDECEKEQGEDQYDLATGEPKLGFTVGFHGQYVERTAYNVSIWLKGTEGGEAWQYPYIMMTAAQIPATGPGSVMVLLQYDNTSVKAEISKGIKSAS